MAFIYSASGEKIELVYSSDDIGVNLEDNEVATKAVRQVKAATKASRSAKPSTGANSNRSANSSKTLAPSASRFGRIVLLRNAEAGASRNSFSTVREAFSRSVTQKVKRALPVFIEPQSGLRLVTTREIAARFKPGTKSQTIKKLLADYGLEIRRTSEFDPHKRILVPKRDVDELLTLDLANTLSELTDDVSFANPNFIAEYRKSVLPDPLLKQQWHLENTGQHGGLTGEDVAALRAWSITAGSPDVVIAIVDDGVDINHPDLKKNIWRNPDPKAKDKNGRNFYDENFDPRPRYFQAPYDALSGNDIHGTPCAGVAAATSSKGGGVGIAYESKILPVKIFGGDNLARNDQVADAIRYAGLHAQVVSCSWSGPPNADLEAAINDVALAGRGGKGTLVFCATGNGEADAISFPAKHKLAFAIGASNDQGIRSQYSNYGEGIDFVAPSSDYDRQGITTTDVSYSNRGFNLKSSYTDDFGGTSSATPLAAGVAALMLSVNPALSRDEVYDILVRSSDKIDKKNGGYKKGYSSEYGYGRVNAYNAVTLAQDKLDKSQDIILEVITFGVKSKAKTVSQLKKELFGKEGKNWKLEKVENSKTSFDAIYTGKEPLPAKDAWELVYQLRSNKNISYAEPSFLIPDLKATDYPGEKSSSKRASFLTGDHDPKTNTDFEWNLAQAKVQKAWELIPPTGGKQQGEGIVIGHPDSGYRQHPELDEKRVLAPKGYDFYNDDETEEDLDGNHGLGTGSVIMSGRNQPTDKPYVTGAAPKAELIPFRVTAKRWIIPAPVLLCGGMQKLRQAINYIVDKKDCHVISMSLGGLPYEPVREAIQRAVNEGIIVLAAAGNVVSFVVWPAAYNEVLALAACDVNGKPWRWTAFGSAVDATAPGHSVWRATITDSGEKTVERSSGTSFAVATTAGIAALWLGFHGRDNLIAKYGKAGLAEAFRKVLTSTCQPSSSLDPAKHGAGIVDAKKVLEAPLPAATGVRSVAKANLKKPLTKLDALAQMFDGVPRETVRQGLGDLLGTRGKTLDDAVEEIGDELAFQFLVDQDSYDAFRKSLKSRSRGAKVSSPSGVTKVRQTLAKQSVSAQLNSRLKT
jgi:subtilisin family serine protease